MNPNKLVALLLTCELLACWAVTPAIAQPPRGRGFRSGEGGGPPGGGDQKQEIKPYDDVITKEAESKPGLFLTHRIGDKLFYEIEPGRLGKDMLWVTQIEQTQAALHAAGEIHFAFAGEQRDGTHFAQVYANRVVGIDRLFNGLRVKEVGLMGGFRVEKLGFLVEREAKRLRSFS